MKVNNFFKRFLSVKFLLGLLIGGALGYAYYHFVGCRGGSCPMWANPWRSTLIGMAFGGILLFDTSKKQDKPKADQEPL
ncbi:MAG: DUF6132 family protein [Bacteroidales bacterium]|jgi:hypothetical protein|nr:DUF6132 family protein [Bacteroidales bacterium]MDY0197447.1 DUF6132 family protein [Tenuifilaceae bacterium]